MIGFYDRVALIARALTEAGIPFAFGGAISLNYYAEPRATTDVDLNIFYLETDSEPTLKALASLGVSVDLEANRERIARNGQIRLDWQGVFVDLFFITVPFLESAAHRISFVPLKDGQIPILSGEDLIVCKIVFNREKDWYDLSAMLTLSGHSLDPEYIRFWLRDLLGDDDRRLERFEASWERYVV